MSEQSFTPFGYLQNPYYQCGAGYYDVQSGVLRSDPHLVGFGWVIPFPRRPHWVVSIGVGLQVGERNYITRDQLGQFELDAVVHTPFRFVYRIGTAHATTYADVWLAERDVLAFRVTHEAETSADKPIVPVLVARAWRPEGEITVEASGSRLRVDREDDDRFATPAVRIDEASRLEAEVGLSWRETPPVSGSNHPSVAKNDRWFIAVPVPDALGNASVTVTSALESASPRIPVVPTLLLGPDPANSAGRAAAEFEAALPRLTGAFPVHFKRGFHYDLETTRLCTLPPAGIFTGHWPTWMVSMPRAVLAEGTMDMARLSYAEPELAKEAILTLLRDTPLENTPCVFASGGYNMVAGDGTRCGTSPAWCIPFLNIYDVYLRTLDDTWAAEVYPHLAALVEYWLSERVDEQGWLTYKCTWEAGEDNNPRIDPEATGHNVISEFVRPVELHASMAHAGKVLATLAARLGKNDDVARFDRLHDEFVEKTRTLFDAESGRFRDFDRRRETFVSVAGEERYWGADFTRQSPLSLIALLGDVATEEQRRLMEEEVRTFFRSPFTIWPSWSTFVLEAAAACGMHEFAGEMAYEMTTRVYAQADRRTLGESGGTRFGATPGASAEYWPYDPATFHGNDAYAWGAQSAAFVIRHILGVRNAETRDGFGLRLRPAIPPGLRAQAPNHVGTRNRDRHEQRWGIENLFHRGRRFSVTYAPAGGTVECTVAFEVPTDLSVLRVDTRRLVYRGGPRTTHRFVLPVADGCLEEVELQ